MFRLARPRFRLRLVASACEAQSTRPERTTSASGSMRAETRAASDAQASSDGSQRAGPPATWEGYDGPDQRRASGVPVERLSPTSLGSAREGQRAHGSSTTAAPPDPLMAR